MTELRRRMREDLQLAGFAPMTQQSYIDAVRRLAKYYKRSPALLTEEEVRRFFLYLINDRKSANSTVTIYLCAIKFFYETTLKRTWNIFDLVRPRHVKKLPVVLSGDEVRTILALIRKPVARMALTTIYSCGLRVSEAARLRVEDVDGERNLLWVRNGKGSKDRSVPLSEPTLASLREFWLKTRAKEWFFPGREGEHINIATLQRAFKAALLESGIAKNASVHNLRHYAESRIMPSQRGVTTLNPLIVATPLCLTRHNHRLLRKARRLSSGQYRPGATSNGVVLAKASSFIFRSAWT